MTLTADRSFKETVLDYNIKLDLFPTLIRIQPFRRKRFRPLQWIVLRNDYVYDRYAIGAVGALSGQQVPAIAERLRTERGFKDFSSKHRSIALTFRRFQTGRGRRKLRRTKLSIAVFQPNRSISSTLSSSLLRFFYIKL